MPRPSYLTSEQVSVGADLGFRTQLDEAISSIRMPTMLDDSIATIRRMAEEPPAPRPQMPMQFGESEPFKVPDLTQTIPGYGVEPEEQRTAGPAVGMRQPATGGGGASFAAGKSPEGQQRVYQAARAAGRSDEDARILAAVTETEGGWGGAIGDQGQSRGIYQFHERGQMPEFRAWLGQQGIQGDPNQLAYDPDIATKYAATTYLGSALDEGRRQGLSGSALATYVQQHGQRSVNPGKTGENYERLYGGQALAGDTETTQRRQQATRSDTEVTNGAPRWGTYTPETLTPNQFNEGKAQGLTSGEALAICGPAAAVAFARANGRNPTLREAKEMAQNLGLWDQGAGMYGPAAQVTLMARMGVKSELREGADWASIAREVQAGRPVIVDTPQHYYTVNGYNAQTGEFEFGQSAGVLTASGGKTAWRPDQIPGLGMGAPRATIFLAPQGR